MAEEKDTAMAQPAKDSTGIVFKGYRSGLILLIPEEGPFQTYLAELTDHLNKARNFFKGAKVTVQTGNRKVSEPEKTALADILKEHGLVMQQLTESTPSKNMTRNGKSGNNDFIDTITVKKTVRSGQTVRFEGNLLIIGDVNPGAEVIASGDIVVLGKLRGIAHAGANGDNNAQIIALEFNPVQIRIAGIFTRDSEKRRGFKNANSGPEVARIKDNLIVVERY